jgi:hypothetical protein
MMIFSSCNRSIINRSVLKELISVDQRIVLILASMNTNISTNILLKIFTITNATIIKNYFATWMNAVTTRQTNAKEVNPVTFINF